MTAHFLGGCAIGDSPETGVIDPYHRMYGHPGLHVVDGSAISANLGVNPSLTITAQAERAMALWPNKGEPDPRPPLGAAYQRLAPVAAAPPAVPAAPRRRCGCRKPRHRDSPHSNGADGATLEGRQTEDRGDEVVVDPEADQQQPDDGEKPQRRRRSRRPFAGDGVGGGPGRPVAARGRTPVLGRLAGG